MNKKTKLVISTIGVLFVAFAIIGTVAYFSKSFTSANNMAKAASFNIDVVNSNGMTIGDGEFNLDDELFPGMESAQVYQFQINKNDTTLSVEYDVKLIPSGALFPKEGHSPITLTLQRKVDNKWVDIDHENKFRPQSSIEDYQVLVGWPHGDNDIDFQGKTGNIKLEVVATQVEPDGTEPSGPPYFTGEIVFKATPNGSTRRTADKGVDFYVNDEGFRVIKVTMGENNDGFANQIGNFTVTEETHNGERWYRVITDNEYYASSKNPWRVKPESVDTSKKGNILFQHSGKPFLSIESDALYEWFTK